MTKKNAELWDTFLSSLSGAERVVYEALAACMTKYGYEPRKNNSNMSFYHTRHNKQLAKMGIRTGKKDAGPFFALRFSACRGLSARFTDVIDANILRFPKKYACCVNGECSFCNGDPFSHVYLHSTDASATHCGAYVLEITDLMAADVPELKKLIEEEHTYLMKHEVGESEGAE